MSEPDPGPDDPPAALIWEDTYVPVPQHKIIVVCPCALRLRTRLHMGIVRRKAQRIPCPGCSRKAFWETVETTSESADFTFGD